LIGAIKHKIMGFAHHASKLCVYKNKHMPSVSCRRQTCSREKRSF